MDKLSGMKSVLLLPTYLGTFFSFYLEDGHILPRRATENPNYSSIAHCCSGVYDLIGVLCASLSKPAYNEKLELVKLKSFPVFQREEKKWKHRVSLRQSHDEISLKKNCLECQL